MSEAVMQRLKISREGVILIKSFEGFRPRAIRRDDGQWVIGYGHTASARDGASVSEADAELLLQYDLIPIAKALNEGVAARLNQHQFDALASFAFSVGLDRFQGSNVLSRLNAGFAGEAADALVSWPEPVLPETALRRRAAERALFVADPAWPVALSDLLAAPLPPPVPAEAPVLSEPPAAELDTAAMSDPVEAALIAAPVVAAPTEDAPEARDAETADVEPSDAPAAEPVAEPAVAETDLAPVEDSPTALDATRQAVAAPLLSEPAPVLRQPEWPETPIEPEADAPEAAADTDATEAEADPATENAADALSPTETPSSTDAVAATAEADPVEDAGPAPTQTPAPALLATPFVASALSTMHRYSAYSGAIVGPLPALTPAAATEAAVAPQPEPEPAPTPEPEATATAVQPDALAAAAAAAENEPEAETVSAAPEADAPEVETQAEPVAPVAEPVEPVAEPAEVEAAPAPVAEAVPAAAPVAPVIAHVAAPWGPEPTPAARDLSAPWTARPVADPFAAAPAPIPAPVPAPALAFPEPDVLLPRFDAFPAPVPAPTPAAEPWPAISADSEPRTDGELVLTAPTEGDVFASPRLVWPQDDQASADTHPMFEDDGSLRLAPGNIIRHETFEETAPPPIPWGELGAYGLMGAFGLVSFGMSMAAFRRASQATSEGDGTTLIAIVLAVIGAACVGVSAYNLYRRWGRAEEE